MMQYIAIFSRYFKSLKLLQNLRYLVQNLSWKHKNVTIWFLTTKMTYFIFFCDKSALLKVQSMVLIHHKKIAMKYNSKEKPFKVHIYEDTQLNYRIAIVYRSKKSQN